MPVPSGFVVKKGWNMRSATAGSNPVPVSLTATSTLLPGSASVEETDSSLVRSVPLMASTPFIIRFRSTCCNCTRSPRTSRSSEPSSVRNTTSCRSQFAAGERQHFPDDVVDVELGQLRPGFPGERAQTTDHLACAHPVSRDAGKRILHFVEIGFIAFQKPLRGLALGHDGGERLIDLMGDRRGELAHRRQPRHSLNVGPCIPQCLLGEFALGDVDRDPGKEEAALWPRGEKAVDLSPGNAAILAP